MRKIALSVGHSYPEHQVQILGPYLGLDATPENLVAIPIAWRVDVVATRADEELFFIDHPSAWFWGPDND